MTKPHISPLGLLIALVILLAFGVRGDPRAAEGPNKENAGATLKGTVVDPAGNPVAGARVSAHSRRSAYAAEYGDPIAQALTDSRGRFELQGVEGAEDEYILLVCADGFADALVLHELGGGVGGEVSAVKLGKAVKLRGRVADTTGKPIEGARVSFRTEEYFSSRPVMTGPDGAFVLAHAPEIVFGLEIARDGYYDAEVDVGPVGRGKPIEVTLVRRPTVTGIVTDAAKGKPIEDASVYCMRREEPVKTDAEGRYTFTGLDEGERRFAAVAPGLASPKLVTVILRNGEATVIDFALEPSTPIRGLVIDSRTKEPVPGVLIEAGIEFTEAELAGPTDRSISVPDLGTFMIPEGRSMDEAVRGTAFSPFTTTSDEKGEFTIPYSYPEMTALYFRPPEHLEDEGSLVGADLSKVLLVELDEGGVIAGRVVRPDGTPAADVTVAAGVGRFMRQSRTGADGRFRFGGLYRADYTLVAVDPGAARGAVTNVGFKRQRVIDDVELTLVGRGWITGSITDGSGTPVSGLSPRYKRLEGDEPEGGRSRGGWGPVMSLYDEALGTEKPSGAGGSYSSGPLLPGTYEVSLSLEREPRRTPDGGKLKMVSVAPEKKTVAVEAGKAADRVDFAIEFEKIERKTTTVSGKVVDQSGAPIAGARVSCYSREIEKDLETTSGADGSFTLTDVDVGSCSIHVSARRFMSSSVRTEAPADDVLVRLDLGGSVTGRVVDAKSGEVVESYQIGFDGPPEACGEYHGAMPDEGGYHPEGRFEVNGLEAGTYHVTIYARGYAPASTNNIHVEQDGVPRDVLVKLVEGTKVTLRVTSALDGQPVAGARIGEHEYFDMETTRRDGTAVFEHRPATPHRLLVRKEGFANKWITFTPDPDKAEMTVEVALDKGITVHGRVVSAVDGEAIRGVFVIMTREGWPKWDEPKYVDPGDRSTRTNADGEFTFDLVSNEHHILTFQHRRHVRTTLAKRFDATTKEMLLVEMGQGGSVVGTVTGPDGEPLSRANVNLSEGEFGDDEDKRTNRQGHFSFKRLWPGTYEVNVRSDAGQSSKRIVEVREGMETRADMSFAGTSLSGTITQDGKPHAGEDLGIRSTTTTWSWASETSAGAETDEQGRYTFDSVPPGEYTLSVHVDDETEYGHQVKRLVQVADKPVVLDLKIEDLEQTVAVTGVIVGEDGALLPGAWSWVDEDLSGLDMIEAAFAVLNRGFHRPEANDDGTFAYRGLEPGKYILYANCRGYDLALFPVERLADQDITNLTVKLQRVKPEAMAQVSGTVRSTIGSPVWPLSLTVLDEQGRVLYDASGDVPLRNNTYTVRVPAGTLKLIAEAYGHAPIVKRLDLRASEERQLDLEFGSGHALTATVVDEQGAPVPGALVVLDAGGHPRLACILSFVRPEPDLPMRQLRGTGPDGTIEFANVPDGEYTVHVRRSGYRDSAAAVRVTGNDAALTVTMPAAGN